MAENQEVVITLQKILDRLNNMLSMGFPVPNDHLFKPEVEVSSTDQSEIPLASNTFVSKLTAKYSDVMVNFDRPITDEEYTIISQDTSKVIMRYVSKIYAKSLSPGGKLTIEALIL